MTERLAGQRILIVEDEVILAWALQDMLTSYGCVVVGPAAGVAEALDLIGREGIDAAVLDVNLNREKCYPVADALVRRGLPFVFSTAYSADNIEEGYRHHPSVQKPHSAPELAEALSALLPMPASLPFPTEAALAAAGIGLWSFHRKRDALRLDAGAQALLGMPEGPTSLATLLARVHEEDQAGLRAGLRAACAETAAREVRFRLVTPEGPRALMMRGAAGAEGNGATGAIFALPEV